MKNILNIVWKDLVIEYRSREIFPTTLLFSVLILLIFNFAFEFKSEVKPNTISAMLWITFTFSGILGLSRSFTLEKENDAIFGMTLTPVYKIYIFIGKFISNLLLIVLMELFVIPVFILFFNLNITEILLPIIGVVILGTIGIISIGTFFSAMVVNTRLKELMLPVLIFPLIIPVIFNSVKICTAIIEGKDFYHYKSSLQVLISFDIIFLTICAVLFEYLLEDN